jgi:hypothetical protein
VAVIGARTYGKGMVQEILPLAGSGDAVKLTIAVYERPSGAPIERHASGGSPEFGGVWPDPGLTIPASDQQWTTWDDALLESDVRANLVAERAVGRRPGAREGARSPRGGSCDSSRHQTDRREGLSVCVESITSTAQ